MINLLAHETVGDLLRGWNRLANEAAKARLSGKYDRAIYKLNAAVRVAEKLGSSCPLLGRSLVQIARCHIDQRNFQMAEAFYERALPILENTLYYHSIELAEALAEVSAVHYGRKNPRQAERILDRSMLILQNQNPSKETAHALNRIGTVFRKVRRYVEAEEFYYGALAIAEHLQDQELIWDICSSLSYICARQKRLRFRPLSKAS